MICAIRRASWHRQPSTREKIINRSLGLVSTAEVQTSIWAKKNILGNLTKQDFIDIWTSKKAMISRKNLYESKRNFAPCNVCNAKGDHIGAKHVKAWKNIE